MAKPVSQELQDLISQSLDQPTPRSKKAKEKAPEPEKAEKPAKKNEEEE